MINERFSLLSLETSISNIQWEKQSNNGNVSLFMFLYFARTNVLYTSSYIPNSLCGSTRDNFVPITLHVKKSVLLGYWHHWKSKLNVSMCCLKKKRCLDALSHFMLEMSLHPAFTHMKGI